MSSFTALNISANDTSDESKDHSRELQVEESFKVFQSALLELKAKRFDEAKEKFDQLFEIEVIKPNKWGVYEYNSPTLDSLRYLAYRNRGLLYYQYVRENFTDMESPDIVDYVLKTLENLLEALQHGDGDSTVTNLLVAIFSSFNSSKLSRSILEYELARSPEEIQLLSSLSAMFKDQKQVIKRYKDILDTLGDAEQHYKTPKDVKKLVDFIKTCNIEIDEAEPLLQRIKSMKMQDDQMVKVLDGVTIRLNELSWEEIAVNLRGLLPKYRISNVLGRTPDSYSELESPIEFVSFNINADFDIQADSPGEPKPEVDKSIEQADTPHNQNCENNSTEDLQNTKRPEPIEKPVQRSSKRFREKDKVQENEVEEKVEFHSYVLQEINSLLLCIGVKSNLSLQNVDPNDTSVIKPLCVSDFYDCLSSWTNKHTEFLKQGQGSTSMKGYTDDFTQLTMLLRSGVFSGDVEPTESLSELEEKEVLEFIKFINEKRLHFHSTRFLLLKFLLEERLDGVCIVTDYFWSPALFEVVEIFSLAMETNLFELIEPTSNHQLISLGVSLYEIMINLLGTICNDIIARKSQGLKISELESQRNKLEKKIGKWQDMLLTKNLSERLKYRYQWTHFCYLQCTTDVTNKDLIKVMEIIEKGLSEIPDFGTISYSNHVNIPSLSLKTVQSQFSKIKMLRRFTIVEVENEEDLSHTDHIDHLYSILNNLGGEGADYESMLNFVNSSPFLMKLKLWKMLMNYFTNKKDQEKFQICYFSSINFLFDRLHSKEYQNQSQLQRQQTLLSTLGHIGEFSQQFFFLVTDEWKFFNLDECKGQLEILISVFQLLYPLIFYETLASRDSSLKSFFKKAVKSSNSLKDILLTVTSLILIYYKFMTLGSEKTSSDDDAVNSIVKMISVLHTLTGKFEFCDNFNGNFLKVQEKLLCKFSNIQAFTQLKRVLWCRYHILVGLDNQEDQHLTQEQRMEKPDAILLSNYLIKFQYADRNPLILNNGRSNFKQFFESVIELVGDIKYDRNHVLSRNEYFFNQFFRNPFTLKTVRDAYAGDLALELTSPNDDIQSGINGGLFYVSAVQALNQYKSRKKSMQARPSELDAIISTLTTDILYNTKRFESWYLLGKCFSYVVEDDLTWTSDKLASKDKKKATSFSQKKAILCYLMALSLYLADSTDLKPVKLKEDNEIIFRSLLESLGEEMLQAYLKPMDYMCYTWKPKPALVLLEDGTLDALELSDKPSISQSNVRKCILMVLAKADTLYSSEKDRNWINPFYIAKVHFKNDKNLFKQTGIQLLIDSCRLSLITSAISGNDFILETHYALVTSCYKCVKSGIFSLEEAMSYLLQDNDFFEKTNEEWKVADTKSFYSLVIELLKRIISKDKKKWHHRPTYRIAQIKYEDFNDVEGAMNEMNKLLALKSVNKNVVNIWKPDNERPGKHFVYAYQYVLFYMDLLNEMHDFMSIGGMIKKLRRFGSGMINSSDAINRAVELFVNGAKIELSLNEKEHGETMMQSIPFPEFVKLSEELFEKFNKDDYESKVLDVFLLAYNLKKGTNSIQFDGVCITIYFKYFYGPFSEDKKESTPIEINSIELPNVNTQENSPLKHPSASPVSADGKSQKTVSKNTSNVRKRVSKKDVFDRIIKLIDKKLS